MQLTMLIASIVISVAATTYFGVHYNFSIPAIIAADIIVAVFVAVAEYDALYKDTE